MSENPKISTFLKEKVTGLYIPKQEDLFEYQVDLLNPYYSTKTAWETFNKHISEDCGGSLEKHSGCRDKFCQGLLEYYDENKVNEKAQKIVEQDNLVQTRPQGKLLPGHTYLSVDLVHAYGQVVEYFNLVPLVEKDLIANYADNEYLVSDKIARVSSYLHFNRGLFNILSERLLNIALQGNLEVFKQLEKLGIPIVRKDVDEFTYDITNLEDTLGSFEGQWESNGVKIHISVEKRESSIIYYDYELHLIPVKENSKGIKNFGDGDELYTSFIPQLVELDQNKSIVEKDLWWENNNGLFKYDKPIQKVYLSSEEVK